MIRDSKKQSENGSAQADRNESKAEQEQRAGNAVKDEKDSKPSTLTRRTSIVIGMCLYILTALGILSHYMKSNYNETLLVRYKQYGNPSKPCVVIIPGLDGATAFFQVQNIFIFIFIFSQRKISDVP